MSVASKKVHVELIYFPHAVFGFGHIACRIYNDNGSNTYISSKGICEESKNGVNDTVAAAQNKEYEHFGNPSLEVIKIKLPDVNLDEDQNYFTVIHDIITENFIGKNSDDYQYDYFNKNCAHLVGNVLVKLYKDEIVLDKLKLLPANVVRSACELLEKRDGNIKAVKILDKIIDDELYEPKLEENNNIQRVSRIEVLDGIREKNLSYLRNHSYFLNDFENKYFTVDGNAKVEAKIDCLIDETIKKLRKDKKDPKSKEFFPNDYCRRDINKYFDDLIDNLESLKEANFKINVLKVAENLQKKYADLKKEKKTANIEEIKKELQNAYDIVRNKPGNFKIKRELSKDINNLQKEIKKDQNLSNLKLDIYFMPGTINVFKRIVEKFTRFVIGLVTRPGKKNNMNYEPPMNTCSVRNEKNKSSE